MMGAEERLCRECHCLSHVSACARVECHRMEREMGVQLQAVLRGGRVCRWGM